MISGSCHCGAVKWEFDGVPESATACNCTVCRRYGVLWAYGNEYMGVTVSGDTTSYTPGDYLGFHFCQSCGCIAYWRALELNKNGERKIAVNLRLSDIAAIADIKIRRFDGLNSFKDLPEDGRCVVDVWS